jgi:HlyD family secretion protein
MNKTISCLAMASLVFIGCSKKSSEAEKTPEPVITVEVAAATSQSIRELLPIDGSYVLSASDFAKLSPVTAGKLETLTVREGDKVKKGQLLAKINTRVLDAQRSSATAGSAAARAQASQSEASLQAAKADYEATVHASELNLQAVMAEQSSNIRQAEIELDRLKAGARPQEISQAQQAVRQAQVNRDRALADSERDKKLLAEGYVSGQQADASKAASDVAESALVQAKDQLQITKLGARTEDLRAARERLKSANDLGRKRVEAARASLDQAVKSKLSVDAKAQEAAAARLNALGKGSDALAAQGLAANGEIRAPFDGVIVRRLVGSGSSVDSTTSVIEIARLGAKIEFAGQATPKNASILSEGMKVLSEGSSEPTGTIRSVGVADPITGQVSIRIIFQSAPAKVSAGSFARVNVQIRRIAQTIVVPEAAVLTREDKQVVFVMEAGVAKMREITVGPAEGGMVSVTKGIKLGDKVVTVGNHELSDGAKVEEAKKDEKKPGDKA